MPSTRTTRATRTTRPIGVITSRRVQQSTLLCLLTLTILLLLTFSPLTLATDPILSRPSTISLDLSKDNVGSIGNTIESLIDQYELDNGEVFDVTVINNNNTPKTSLDPLDPLNSLSSSTTQPGFGPSGPESYARAFPMDYNGRHAHFLIKLYCPPSQPCSSLTTLQFTVPRKCFYGYTPTYSARIDWFSESFAFLAMTTQDPFIPTSVQTPWTTRDPIPPQTGFLYLILETVADTPCGYEESMETVSVAQLMVNSQSQGPPTNFYQATTPLLQGLPKDNPAVFTVGFLIGNTDSTLGPITETIVNFNITYAKSFEIKSDDKVEIIPIGLLQFLPIGDIRLAPFYGAMRCYQYPSMESLHEETSTQLPLKIATSEIDHQSYALQLLNLGPRLFRIHCSSKFVLPVGEMGTLLPISVMSLPSVSVWHKPVTGKRQLWQFTRTAKPNLISYISLEYPEPLPTPSTGNDVPDLELPLSTVAFPADANTSALSMIVRVNCTIDTVTKINPCEGGVFLHTVALPCGFSRVPEQWPIVSTNLSWFDQDFNIIERSSYQNTFKFPSPFIPQGPSPTDIVYLRLDNSWEPPCNVVKEIAEFKGAVIGYHQDIDVTEFDPQITNMRSLWMQTTPIFPPDAQRSDFANPLVNITVGYKYYLPPPPVHGLGLSDSEGFVNNSNSLSMYDINNDINDRSSNINNNNNDNNNENDQNEKNNNNHSSNNDNIKNEDDDEDDPTPTPFRSELRFNITLNHITPRIGANGSPDPLQMSALFNGIELIPIGLFNSDHPKITHLMSELQCGLGITVNMVSEDFLYELPVVWNKINKMDLGWGLRFSLFEQRQISRWTFFRITCRVYFDLESTLDGALPQWLPVSPGHVDTKSYRTNDVNKKDILSGFVVRLLDDTETFVLSKLLIFDQNHNTAGSPTRLIWRDLVLEGEEEQVPFIQPPDKEKIHKGLVIGLSVSFGSLFLLGLISGFLRWRHVKNYNIRVAKHNAAKRAAQQEQAEIDRLARLKEAEQELLEQEEREAMAQYELELEKEKQLQLNTAGGDGGDTTTTTSDNADPMNNDKNRDKNLFTKDKPNDDSYASQSGKTIKLVNDDIGDSTMTHRSGDGLGRYQALD